MSRRKRRLRIDRVLICLLILVGLICIVRFTIYTIYGFKILNQAKKGETVKLYHDNANLWKSTVKYINEDMDELTYTYRNYTVTMDSSYFKKNMNIKPSTENKKITNNDFLKQKGLYIKNNNIMGIASKIKLKLPHYLYKNGYVDLYGIDENSNYILLESRVKVSDKFFTLNIYENYTDYFITYVKLESIKTTQEYVLTEGDTKEIKLEFNPSNATNKKVTYSGYDENIITVDHGLIKAIKEGKTTVKVKGNDMSVAKIKIIVNKKKEEKKDTEKKEEKPKVTQGDDGIYYIDGIMIVNKSYPLPESYDPGKLLPEFMDAFTEMQADAQSDGIKLWIQSGYRSYDYQVGLYDMYVRQDGRDRADTYSARPGYSEHQSGLAADINNPSDSFNGTSEAIWLKENCYKYGFIIRFPENEDEYTGYKYESWHIRYVGKELSNKIHEAGDISLEKYYGIESKYSN
ncbi:MAG: D-alanyl-D-alanine carboxypeptidase family protein [Bacilli bacterium]|nr:D-alanyl-D-alanine carboxypeptidase family protein [Bacilli bacterium]